MLKPLICLLALALPAPALAAEAIDVLVLGTFHLANPRRDLNNVKAIDVTAPDKQAELEALANKLALFRPTKILIERQAKAPDFEVSEYQSFTPSMLTTDRNENAQIGYRLAAKLGHKTVFGFDEQPASGEPDYFPFERVQAYAIANGKADWLQDLFAPVQTYTKRIEADQRTRPIAAILAWMNEAETIGSMHRTGYYELLKLGDGEAQPGADLNAMWYLRNAKMFGKITNIAQPGDRVLVVVGAGHSYWLRHLVSETPGYRLVDPVPYLKAD